MAFGDKLNEKDDGLTVLKRIATDIAKITPKVEDAVVDAMVKRELNKRTEAVVQVMDNLSKLEGDLRKIKPDQVQIDDAGKEISSSFSKAKFEELKKHREKIEKHRNALTKALEKGDFGDLYNLKNSGSGGGGSKPEADTSSD